MVTVSILAVAASFLVELGPGLDGSEHAYLFIIKSNKLKRDHNVVPPMPTQLLLDFQPKYDPADPESPARRTLRIIKPSS